MSEDTRADVEAHGIVNNINETTVADDEVESHGIGLNVDETVVEDED